MVRRRKGPAPLGKGNGGGQPERSDGPESTFLTWTDRDVEFTKIFKAWFDLPVDVNKSFKLRMNVLRQLDDVIDPFDAHIYHSDEGFRAWRRLHQSAMEQGLAKIPNWPALRTHKNGSLHWADNEWDKRYKYLVQQREKLTLDRLREIGCDDFKGHFFGSRDESPPREMVRVLNRTKWRLMHRWYLPIDLLLETHAQATGWGLESLKELFWGEDAYRPSPTTPGLVSMMSGGRFARDAY